MAVVGSHRMGYLSKQNDVVIDAMELRCEGVVEDCFGLLRVQYGATGIWAQYMTRKNVTL